MNSAIELIANVQSIRLELTSLPSVLRSLARSGNADTVAFVLMTKASLSLDLDFLVGSRGPSRVPPRCVIWDDREPIVLGRAGVRVVGAPRSEPQCLIGAPLGRRPAGPRPRRSGAVPIDSSRSPAPPREVPRRRMSSRR